MARHRRPRRPLPNLNPTPLPERSRSAPDRGAGMHRAPARRRGRSRAVAAAITSVVVATATALALAGGVADRGPAGSGGDGLAGFGAVVGSGRAPTGTAVPGATTSTPRPRSTGTRTKARRSAPAHPRSSASRSRPARPRPAHRTSPAASSTPSSTVQGCVSQAQGIPRSGAYLGAAVSGSASLPALERDAGRRLAIHRTYFLADQVDAAIRSVQDDLAAGRLPWISFKLPYSWADMASGRGDAWATGLADRLARVRGPVWLAFHHEPEGDGNMQDWTRMQQHLAPLIHARTDNVAYTVILIAWNSLFGPNADQHLDQVYPGSQYVDVLGMDVYNEYGAKSFVSTSLDPMRYFGVLGPWARKHGVAWAVAETGYTKKAADVDRTWLQTAYRDLKAEGGVALTYFNSSLNSIADWTLDDPVRAGAFNSLLTRSVRICSG